MPTDTERLDFIQKLNDEAEYTGKVILRGSQTGRGWRLHETSRPNAVSDVRDAIDLYMEQLQFAKDLADSHMDPKHDNLNEELK